MDQTRTLTYPGDTTQATDLVVGGAYVVISRDYDTEADVTRVTLAPLTDPRKILESRGVL